MSYKQPDPDEIQVISSVEEKEQYHVDAIACKTQSASASAGVAAAAAAFANFGDAESSSESRGEDDGTSGEAVPDCASSASEQYLRRLLGNRSIEALRLSDDDCLDKPLGSGLVVDDNKRRRIGFAVSLVSTLIIISAIGLVLFMPKLTAHIDGAGEDQSQDVVYL